MTPSFSGQMMENEATAEQIFQRLCKDIQKSDKVLLIAQEETADWGASLGFAYGLKKEIVILAEKESYIPFMAARMKSKILRVDNLRAIQDYADSLATLIINSKNKQSHNPRTRLLREKTKSGTQETNKE